MRTTTAMLFGLAGICNFTLAQDAACTAGAQAAYTPLASNQDAAEYCFDKVHRSDDSATITASATLDSLRFRRRKDKTTTSRDDNSGHHGGDDEDKGLKSLLKSLSQGPFSVASTFCSCNFPSASVTATPTGPCSGFFNGTATLNSTITATDSLNSTITATASLNATTTSDDSTITAIATLITLTNADGTVVTTTIDDDSTGTSVDDSATTSV